MTCARCAKLQAELAALKERLAWAEGRKGETGRNRADGFTSTQTVVLRKLVASGHVFHGPLTPCLQRHMSHIKAILRKKGIDFEIRTLVGQGYELVRGKEALLALIADTNPNARPTRGSTVPQGEAICSWDVR